MQKSCVLGPEPYNFFLPGLSSQIMMQTHTQIKSISQQTNRSATQGLKTRFLYLGSQIMMQTHTQIKSIS